ncbi:hypothetical protein BKI52_14105 [marine bacterium AO1-C]|nr:hypothetical protein BKI52_14105 [marine bacterium AO1-C]
MQATLRKKLIMVLIFNENLFLRMFLNVVNFQFWMRKLENRNTITRINGYAFKCAPEGRFSEKLKM